MLETAEKIHKTAEELMSRRVSKIEKLRIKCWVYHSCSRIRNGNPPFNYTNFTRNFQRETYLDYINLDLIDCDDLGGKEFASNVVKKWFGY